MDGIGETALAIKALGAAESPAGSTGAPLQNAILRTPEPATFGDTLSGAIDSLSSALARADALAVSVAQNRSSIAEAAVARAKADVLLEVAAIASAKVSGAISQLLQTQL